MRLWSKVFAFWQRYEHHIGVGALILGFMFDLIIAKRPDSTTNNVLLLCYLVIAGLFIVILNLREMRRKEGSSAEPLFLLLVLQFCFGGLASNLLVLYGHSGTLAGSAVFVGLLVALVFGNEYLRGRYTLLRFNVVVYYFLLLTYCVIAVPTFIFHRLNTWVFLASGILSLVCIAIFLAFLYVTVLRKQTKHGLYDVSLLIAIVFMLFNGLYFLNIIPPVPLSLKDIGVYHSLLKQSSGSFVATYEPPPWYVFWRDTNEAFTAAPGSSAFCFSSVFAPTDLATAIYHRWEWYDPAAGEWVTLSHVSFAISGGREGGYRGWTMKSALSPGKWRCDVETQSGALIGRVTFTVVTSSQKPALSQKTL